MLTKQNIGLINTLFHAIGEDLGLLSVLHAAELEVKTIAELKALGFPNGLGLHLKSRRSVKTLKQLSKVVQRWPDKVEIDFLHNLDAEFTAIYLSAQIGVSPQESYWLDEEQLVMQKQMFQVRELYQVHGLRVDNWRLRADDHLVNELNFLTKILGEKIYQNKLEVAARFLDDHLLQWIDQFADIVAERSESAFYRGLALLTASYCNELRDLLELILDQPRPSPDQIKMRLNESIAKAVKVAPPTFGAASGPTW